MTHRDPSLRAGALTVLGRHMRGDTRIISTLVDTLRGEDSSAIRVQAVEKLGELGDVSVVATLKEIARHEGEPKLRRAIAFAVASIETRSCGD
jgi:HEAT repeat protein